VQEIIGPRTDKSDVLDFRARLVTALRVSKVFPAS
jgi:hypothetical protein